MDSERVLRTEFRRALDDVLPPVPWLETTVAEDLRNRRAPASGNRAAGKARRVAVPRHAMQLAAGALIALLAAVAVAAFLELHGRAPHSTPAGMDPKAYKAMTYRDLLRLDTAGDGAACLTLQSVCPAPGRPVHTALRLWLADLNGSLPPARFAVIDGQLRRHIATQISMLETIYAVYAARDDAALARANYAASAQGTWVADLAQRILDSRQESPSAYLASVRDASQTFSGCPACQALAAARQADCAQIQATGCEVDVSIARTVTEQFQAALVLHGAPSSLAARDTILQRDLAQADTAIISMASANLSGDQATFDAGLQELAQALPAIQADVAVVMGG